MIGSALFVCDGHFRSGFGHAARCLQIAQILVRKNPAIKIIFYGEYASGARQRLEAGLARIVFAQPTEAVKADVALIDRMSDFDDIEACDRKLVESVAANCHRTIYLASGLTQPDLPNHVTCIGYQPSPQARSSQAKNWSLDYAPVSSDLLKYRSSGRDTASALISFGGAPDDRAPRIAAYAIAAMEDITYVKVLLSPVNGDVLELPLRTDQRVTYFRNIPEVGLLLAQSGVVLASFGNLGYEALALGAPLCLLGTKKFQADLAEEFAKRNVATTAGLLDDGAQGRMALALRDAIERRDELSANAKLLIDGFGIDRIARVLLDGIQ